MENFPFEHNGKKYWYSRSMAVSVFVFTTINNELHVLMNQRGEGAPDYKGHWSAPCGYLDHNETLSQAGARELYEEVGLVIDHRELIPMEVNSLPTENRQNVTQRYMVYIPYKSFTEDMFSTINSEKDEVADIKWIPISNLISPRFKVAFNHDTIALYFSECVIIYSIMEDYVNDNYKNIVDLSKIEPYTVVNICSMPFVVGKRVFGETTHGKVCIRDANAMGNQYEHSIAYPSFTKYLQSNENVKDGVELFGITISHIDFPHIKFFIN